MSDENETWVALLTAAMAVLVGSLLFLNDAVWYVQYGGFAVSLLLSLAVVVRAGPGSA